MLPVENLPPLVLGPLMIVAGVSISVPASQADDVQLRALLLGLLLVAGGVAVTAFGLWKKSQKSE